MRHVTVYECHRCHKREMSTDTDPINSADGWVSLWDVEHAARLVYCPEHADDGIRKSLESLYERMSKDANEDGGA